MKQVPAYSDGNMDEKTGLIIRSGLKSVVNSYDLAALETALQIKAQTGASVSVFTMGPENAKKLVKEAYAMGADDGYLICDKAFAGADVLATSYTLMQAITSVAQFDLIICGRQTTDGDTAQVSGALAKWLGLPHLNWVTEMIAVNQQEVIVKYRTNDSLISAAVSYPALLSVEKSIFVPRLPSLKLKIAAGKKAIKEIKLQHLNDQDELNYGIKGSPTRVVKIFPPERTSRQTIKVMTGEAAADYLTGLITQSCLGRGGEYEPSNES